MYEAHRTGKITRRRPWALDLSIHRWAAIHDMGGQTNCYANRTEPVLNGQSHCSTRPTHIRRAAHVSSCLPGAKASAESHAETCDAPISPKRPNAHKWCVCGWKSTKARFASILIRTFQLLFSAETIFFSHNKSPATIFCLVFSAKRIEPKALLHSTRNCDRPFGVHLSYV